MTDNVTINVNEGANPDWDDVVNKPATFAPEAHTQAISTITGLQDELDDLADFPTVQRAAGNYTLALSDGDTTQQVTAAAVITVPLNATVAFPIGTIIAILADTVSAVSISAADGVTIKSENQLILNARYAMAGLLKIATDTWVAVGSLRVPS
ncbi:MAG: hypothetical protein CVU44_11385 [Chloroflexi bacterium HGW-Chloroflexi-6]|nr:MAG: hypothetical protein CVU44_11385 [Chloroflexi bacterium HGW-Chloroflexi-6]